jgi:hypothetical protein
VPAYNLAFAKSLQFAVKSEAVQTACVGQSDMQKQQGWICYYKTGWFNFPYGSVKSFEKLMGE